MRIIDIEGDVVHWDVKDFIGGKSVMLTAEEWEHAMRYFNTHGIYLTVL